MGRVDIREVKKALREELKQLRREMPPQVKAKKDQAIFHRLTTLPEYQNSSIFLCFVSTPIEVDTHALIRQALEDGKTVGVPRCVDGTCQMEMFEITSFEDLEPRTFSVLEPKPERCKQLTDFVGALCVVPGLAFDLEGFRLGYGKGYYDRFLAGFPGITAGICYNACMKNRLPHGRFDRPVELLVTEKFIKRYSGKPVPFRDKKQRP